MDLNDSIGFSRYALDGAEGLVNYVFSYSQGDLTFRFAVRSDAVPLFPESEVRNREER